MMETLFTLLDMTEFLNKKTRMALVKAHTSAQKCTKMEKALSCNLNQSN